MASRFLVCAWGNSDVDIVRPVLEEAGCSLDVSSVRTATTALSFDAVTRISQAREFTEVRKELRITAAVSVTAENSHALLRCGGQGLPQHVTHRLTREDGQPVVVIMRALMPARLPKRRDVHLDDHVPVLLPCRGKHFEEVRCGFVAESMEHRQPLGRVLTKPTATLDVIDQPEVIQQHIGRGVNTEQPIAPAVLTDQARLAGQPHETGIGQPVQVRSYEQGVCTLPRSGDRTS